MAREFEDVDGELDLSLGFSIGGGSRNAARGGWSHRRSDSAAVSGDADLDLGGGDPQHSLWRKRKVRENEASPADRWSPNCRKIDSQISGISGIENPNHDPTLTSNPNPNPAPQTFPVTPMQYGCHQIQYVPVVNGFGIPCLMPFWVPTISSATANCSSSLLERNVYHPVACRPPAWQSMDLNGGKGIALSSADSPASSSLGISVSLQGGSRSNSHTLVSSTAESSLVSNSDAPAPTQGKLGGSLSVNKPNPVDPKTGGSTPSSLPRMPCVATTGNGPDGRTITGFLHRYTQSEVSIVCVCHRRSFSPAEFVQHAGGTDTSHPLRQIVMVSL